MTEFLAKSSAGHMILADSLKIVQQWELAKIFEIAKQLGAIAAVFMLFSHRFLREMRLYFILGFAFLPTCFAGLLV